MAMAARLGLHPPLASPLPHRKAPPSSPRIPSAHKPAPPQSFRPSQPIEHAPLALRAKKKGWLDPFDYGHDPNLENGDLFGEGLQEPELPLPPFNPNSELGFRDFPAMHNPEIASLGLMLRGDVRRCCCLVAGGVYENLLFFPVIRLMKDRYPGVKIDVIATDRGKQTYEMNKNVFRAWVFDFDSQYTVPVEYMEFIGKLKNEYYDMVISTKLAGIGHSFTMWLTDCRDKISYVYPNVNAAGSGIFLTKAVKAPRANLAEGGYAMYAELMEVLAKPAQNNPIPKMHVRPLEVSISRRLKEIVREKYVEAGVSRGEFLVIHGIKTDSTASMQSRGDPDSLLPIELWADLAYSIRSKVVFVVPKKLDILWVWRVVGGEAKVVFISTPGQLGAIINDSLGVIATNTAAIQLAHALKKPSVALFSSSEKASLFVPDAEQKNCRIVASKTGRLVDIDVKAAKTAITSIAAKMMVTV